jgi:Subtilase family
LTRAALAALVAAAIAAATSGSPAAAFQPAELEPSRGFCGETPQQPLTSVAAAVNALDVTLGGTAPIAILDTGVDGSIPELAGRIVSPYDVLDKNEDADDVDGHGSEVAAIAAATPGLFRGISTSSPIMPVQIYTGDGSTTAGSVVAGMRWAIDHGAGAIDISGIDPLATASAADVTALTRIIGEAFNKGIMVVAPVGNEGTTQANIPAALPHVLAVGGMSDSLGTRSTFSNVGSWVDLLAPGQSITLPAPRKFCPHGYGLANGTSFAAPAVAAAAAMVSAARPDLTPQQRFDVLRKTARDVSLGGRDDETGFGVLDVGAALTAPAPAKEASAEPDDDPIYVRGPNASKHPSLLSRGRSQRVAGQLSRGKDPADVYPVKVGKNKRLLVTVKAGLADSVLDINIYKPGAGDYDVSGDATKQRVVGTGGFAGDPQLVAKITKAGTYYVSVEVPDLIDPDETAEDTAGVSIPAAEPYTLAVSTKALPKPKKKPKKKTTSKKKK